MTRNQLKNMISETASLTLATSTAAETPETATALVIARHDVMTPSELAQGGASKRAYCLARVAAGATKATALGEFEAALSAHRTQNKAALGALSTLATVDVARLTKTKTGWVARLVDKTAAQEKAAAKAAALVEKYRAKIVALEAAARA